MIAANGRNDKIRVGASVLKASMLMRDKSDEKLFPPIWACVTGLNCSF